MKVVLLMYSSYIIIDAVHNDPKFLIQYLHFVLFFSYHQLVAQIEQLIIFTQKTKMTAFSVQFVSAYIIIKLFTIFQIKCNAFNT